MPLYKGLHIKRIANLYYLSLGQFMHKQYIIQNACKHIISELFNRDVHTYCT